MPIDDADIQWALSIAESEDLAEIEIHVGDCELLVRRCESTPFLTAAPILADGVAQGAAPVAPEQLPDNLVPIATPMSGVFYRSASPESPPYVEVGQEVREGETVGLIEAMKLFNDVHSPVSGTVKKVLAENEEHVEAGQTLILVET